MTTAPEAAIALPVVADRASDSIANVQTAGVDGGGIVNRRGDILVMLRRGRLFILSTADDEARLVDRINVFPGGGRRRRR